MPQKPLLRRLFPKKHALVIGNNAYPEGDKLLNSVRDAQEIHNALHEMGFKSILKVNQTGPQLRAELESFVGRCRTADLAVLFFSGHGEEHDHANQLLGTESRPGKYDADGYVRLTSTLEELAQCEALTVAIIDACRTYPDEELNEYNAPQPGQASADGPPDRPRPTAPPPADNDDASVPAPQRAKLGRSRGRQVALRGEDRRADSYYAFATQPGQVAWEGDEQVSPFTSAILERVDIPGLEVEDLFRWVRRRVYETTDRYQDPYLVDGLTPGERVSLRPRSWYPLLAATLLAAMLSFFVACIWQWQVAQTTLFGRPVLPGVAFAILVTFACWRWGQPSRQNFTIGVFAFLAWSAAVISYNQLPAPAGYPFLPLATSSIVGIGFLAFGLWASVHSLRAHFALFLVATAALVVAGSFFWAVSPLPKPLNVGDYYNVGIWQTLILMGLGVTLSRVTYKSSNRHRRLRSDMSDGRPLAFAALGGLAAALASPPIEQWLALARTWAGGSNADRFPEYMNFLYIDIFGGGTNPSAYPVALPFALVVAALVAWRFRDLSATIVAGAGAVLAWLLAMSARGGALGSGSSSNSTAPDWMVEIGSIAVMGAVYGLVVMGVLSMLRPRLWNARLWLPGITVSLVATLPFAASGYIFHIKDNWWAFYIPWCTLMAVVIAYALVTSPVVERTKDGWQLAT